MELEGSGAFRRPGSIVRVLRTERWVRPTERAGSEGSFICRCLGQRKPSNRASLRGPPIGGQDHDGESYRCSAPYTLLPLRGISPQGETRDMREKTGASYASCTTPAFPPLVAGATTLPGGKHVTGFSVAYGSLRIQFLCHPRSSVGRQKESALMGRLGALLRPTWRSYAGPPQWHYNPCLL